MTQKLLSNESRYLANPTATWCGIDPEIEYPAVSICFTVTCVFPNGRKAKKLAGAHFMPMKLGHVKDDITEFGEIARNPESVYVIGWMENWKAGSKHCPRDMQFDSDNGGSLLKHLAQELGFIGTVTVLDLADAGTSGEVDIYAKLIGGAVEFSHGEDRTVFDLAKGKSITTAQMGIIPQPDTKAGCSCTIM